jgi:hypothetical protein
MGELVFAAVLPFRLTNANVGRTKQFGASERERKSLEVRLRGAGLVRQPFSQPVTLRLTRILGMRERYWDSDSGLRGNSKELIDSLVACGWFHDDGMDWILETRFAQDKTQRENGPAILVEVFYE